MHEAEREHVQSREGDYWVSSSKESTLSCISAIKLLHGTTKILQDFRQVMPVPLHHF